MLGKVLIRQLSSLAEPLPRLTHGKYPVPNTPGYKKLMENQTRFCRDDGLLVWQKSSTDVMLYRAAFSLAVLGTVFSVAGLVKLMSPPKN
jgi:hypothetical protein